MTARTPGSSTCSISPSRGIIRPRSDSPFVRNVRTKSGEEHEMEAITCLLDFAMRQPSTKTHVTPTHNAFPEVSTVRTFSTLPVTPAPAARPVHPPRIGGRRPLSRNLPRPRALLPSTLGTRTPSAALGAPPREEEEREDGELPDIPTPPTSPYSDVTIMRLVLFFNTFFLKNRFFSYGNIVQFFSYGNIVQFFLMVTLCICYIFQY